MAAAAGGVKALRASAVELAAAIRDGRTTSEAVVDAHIERARLADGRTNALVVPLFERARAAARDADERVRASRRSPSGRSGGSGPAALPPLLGVPCSIKEAFALAGQPNTAGLVSRVGRRAEATAPAVQRLLDAGAIPIGLTNTSELCMWFESANAVYGRTSSAYSPRRTAGGSSGGEGAAVGAGMAPFGLGSDIGGSIRIPAFFNGVFGHKGSPGLVPNEGQYPVPGPEAGRLLSTGPLCRRAGDLMPLLRILAGERAADVGDPASVAIDGLRVVACPGAGPLPIGRAVRRGIERATGALAAAGAAVRHDRFPRVLVAIELWAAALRTAEPQSFRELLGDGTPARRRELVRDLAAGRSPHTAPSVLLAIAESLSDLTPRRTRRLVERGRALAGEVEELIGDGVLLFPPHPRVAPRHGTGLLTPLAPGHTAIFNVLGLPVTQVPTGLTVRGLPTGVQVVAGRGRDHVAIAVAEELERRLGGWVDPW